MEELQIQNPKSEIQNTEFATIEDALADFRAGKFVIVADDASRENEGDLVMAAQFVDKDAINFLLREARGMICVPLTGERLDALQLGPMTERNTDRHGTSYTATVDASRKFDTTTGVGASDRARAVKVLIDPQARPDDLSRPGHTQPLRARDGGVLVRAGHTEAAIDLCKMAGLFEGAVICEVMDEDGDPARLPALQQLAKKHDLKIITIEDLIRYRRQNEKLVRRVASAKLPTAFGEFQVFAYESILDGTPYLALVKGEIWPDEPTLVRVHSGCLTGDALLSLRCDCSEQLHTAMHKIQNENSGVLLYIAHHEGRGIGILNKLRAYALQDEGADTEQANHALGFASDLREYGTGAQVLADLGVRRMKLLTNNPAKRVGLEGYGLTIVERVPLRPTVRDENKDYLDTKRLKMGHLLDEDNSEENTAAHQNDQGGL